MAPRIVSEAEAATMLCCGPSGCGIVVDVTRYKYERFCAGRRCMAWQESLPEHEVGPFAEATLENRPEGEGWFQQCWPCVDERNQQRSLFRWARIKHHRGWCGFIR